MAQMTLSVGTPTPPPDPSYPTVFDYYISPTGLNTNPGTLGSPWALTALDNQTVGNRLSLVTPGKVIGLTGTFRAPLTGISSNGQWINFGNDGQALSRITIAATTKGAATITDNNGSGVYPALNFALVRIFGDFITLRGVNFDDTRNLHIAMEGDSNTVQDCLFRNLDTAKRGSTGGGNSNVTMIETARAAGLYCTNLTVTNCHFENCRSDNYTDVGPWGINRGLSIHGFRTAGIIVQDCTFIDVKGCLSMKSHGSSSKYLFRRNFARHVYEPLTYFLLADPRIADGAGIPTGVSIPASLIGPNKAYNNVLLYIDTCWDATTGEAYNNWNETWFYNNTVILGPDDQTGAYRSGLAWRCGPQGDVNPRIGDTNKVFGNIIAYTSVAPTGDGTTILLNWGGNALSTLPAWLANPSRDVSGYRPAQMMVVHDYNWYRAVRFDDFDTVTVHYLDLPTWRAATGLDVHSNSGDPQISNLAGTTAADFQLAGGSPCLSFSTVDGIFGSAAENCGAWTIGLATIGADF